MFASRRKYIPQLFLILAFASCTSVRYLEDISEYEARITSLRSAIRADSTNAAAHRDLGVIYFQTRRYQEAQSYLQRAIALDPQDPKSVFYFGMTLEFRGKDRLALKVHEKFRDASRRSPYRRLMEGRYHRLRRQLVRAEIRDLLAREDTLTAERMSNRALAVFPMRYQGTDQAYAPLGRGLSEMIISDLGKVAELKLVERIHLKTLIEEMKLGESEVFDQKTAPRLGKLLGAGRVIQGSYDVLSEERLDWDVLSWDVLTQQFPGATRKSDLLKNLFDLEKELVFTVLQEMGISPTPVEMKRIRDVPTRNMQAFLSYCLGLEEEDAGNYRAAARHYRHAVSLDPGFQAAVLGAETSGSQAVAGGTGAGAVSIAYSIDPPPTPGAPTLQPDLVSRRYENLGTGVGSNFVPGQDSRQPAEEAGTAGVSLGALPEPPDLPEAP